MSNPDGDLKDNPMLAVEKNKKISRRRFLQLLGAATGGVALSSCVLQQVSEQRISLSEENGVSATAIDQALTEQIPNATSTPPKIDSYPSATATAKKIDPTATSSPEATLIPEKILGGDGLHAYGVIGDKTGGFHEYKFLSRSDIPDIFGSLREPREETFWQKSSGLFVDGTDIPWGSALATREILPSGKDPINSVIMPGIIHRFGEYGYGAEFPIPGCPGGSYVHIDRLAPDIINRSGAPIDKIYQLNRDASSLIHFPSPTQGQVSELRSEQLPRLIDNTFRRTQKDYDFLSTSNELNSFFNQYDNNPILIQVVFNGDAERLKFTEMIVNTTAPFDSMMTFPQINNIAVLTYVN